MVSKLLVAINLFAVTLVVGAVVFLLVNPGYLSPYATTDLEDVRPSKEIPPFFDNVFREEDLRSAQVVVRDPYVVRIRPLATKPGIAPTDILGLRNRLIPHIADVITIGDSQTFGLGVPFEENWPNQLSASIADGSLTFYSMAVGGWGGAQYLEMTAHALWFRPRVLIVAFYSGNDPLETHRAVYRKDRWADLRSVDHNGVDPPRASWPVKPDEIWKARLVDGTQIAFTPQLRLSSNVRHPAIEEAYRLLGEIAGRIVERASQEGALVLFTIIPTKELVFAPRLEAEGVEAPPEFMELVASELHNIRRLETRLRSLRAAEYVSVVDALQRAAKARIDIYPRTTNGHPSSAGYAVVARALEPHLRRLLDRQPRHDADWYLSEVR